MKCKISRSSIDKESSRVEDMPDGIELKGCKAVIGNMNYLLEER